MTPPGDHPVLDPVAIVGIGCRYAGGVDRPDALWELVATGTDAIGPVPADRWDADAWFDPDPTVAGRMAVREGGFLSGPVDRFDAGFFGLSPKEAAALDPQQRLLLEVTWEAFEDAGIPPSSTAGAAVGTYVGGFTFDAALNQLADLNRGLIGASTSVGVSLTMLAARLAYTFDWHGPALTIDTACSSSLVALHHACTAIDRGECETAVAGGVNVMTNPITAVSMSQGRFLSPNGRSRPFDHRADGYGRGEGAGILVLKSLAAALRDGDRVRGVVRGSAVNQDGHTPGITVPSGAAQQAVIRAACRSAGVDPRTLDVVEAHGTGTAVGDPIEAGAIGAVLGGSARRHWIGSIKGNVGHTEAAAGVAGVIKACLCLERGQVPPVVHFEQPNPAIPFDALPLRVPTAVEELERPADRPLRAGVNSFGFGGTNAHVVLEAAPASAQVSESTAGNREGAPRPVVVSARSPEALTSLAGAYAEQLRTGADLDVFARAAARTREHHPLRAAVVATSPAGTAEALDALRAPDRRAAPGGRTAFVYTGMGPQWWGMGAELLATERVFAATIAEADEILATHGIRVADELRRPEAESRLTETVYAQVANAAVQLGLTALWRHWGVVPDAIVGHSVGEVAAFHAAGIYTLEDALTVSVHRASLQATLAGRGGMLAVDRPQAELRPLLPEGVGIAAVNSPGATTVAGDHGPLAAFAERLRADGARATALRVEVAYHSPQMDAIREPLLAALAGLRPRKATVPLYSTVTGARVDGPELDAGYWWRNVRETVRFDRALRAVLADGATRVVEIGPHPVLAGAVDEALTEPGRPRDTLRVASLRRDRPQRAHLLEALTALWAHSVELDWAAVLPGHRGTVDLSRYPWQRERHWTESAGSRERLTPEGPRFRGRTVAAPRPVRELELSPAGFGYLPDHRIGESVVLPAAGHIEAALAQFPADVPRALTDIVFAQPLVLPPHGVTTLRVERDPERASVRLFSRDDAGASWIAHVRMHQRELDPARMPTPREPVAELTRGWPVLTRDEVYDGLAQAGSTLRFGRAFRVVERLWARRGPSGLEVAAQLDTSTVDTTGYRMHPALLDGALQAVMAGAARTDRHTGTYVPARIGRLHFFRSPGATLWMHAVERPTAVDGQLACDLTLVTDGGEIVAEIGDLRAQRLAGSGAPASDLLLEPVWHPEPLPEGGELGSWVVAGPGAAPLAAAIRAGGGTAHVCEGDDWAAEVARVSPGTSGVVWVDRDPDAGAPDRTGPVCAPVAGPAQLVRALPEGTGPLVLVTVGAQGGGSLPGPTCDPGAAAVWGLGRVIEAERPDLSCRLVDLEPGAGWAGLLAELAHMADPAPEDEVAVRGGVRHVRRIVPAGPGPRTVAVHPTDTPVRLDATGRHLEDLRWSVVPRRVPGVGEVEVAVSHVGVGLPDLLRATGRPGAGTRLGSECAGTVVAAGDGVTGLAVGDPVIVHAGGVFASRITVGAERVLPRPAALDPAVAASLLPAAVAHLALVGLARIRPGERVLVHSAGGGVGLAAVRIAHALGAEVYATAGSEHRRAILRAEGVAWVGDSRTSTFADDVREQGGVDVVLSALSGDLRDRSLELLRPFGRFVELGRTDIAADRPVGLAAFGRALTFHSLDLDLLRELRPDALRTAAEEVLRLLADGTLTASPVRTFPAAGAEAALRALTGDDHHGRIVVGFDDAPVPVDPAAGVGPVVRPDGTYVVTGGLGGLGLSVAGCLAAAGARHLVLLGRSGTATDRARTTVDALRAAGTDVRVERVDLAEGPAVHALFARLRAEGPPVRGVVHGAADFTDAVLAEADPARLLAATGPKADGAWHLHEATTGDPLDFLVLFSSVAGQFGAGGMAAYASANAFLDGLARARTAAGLPATSVAWGMVDEIGVAVAGDGVVGRTLRRNGQLGMPPERVVAELTRLLATRPVEVAVADIDWARWARANPQLAALPRFRDLVPEVGGAGADVGSRLRAATPDERAALLPELVGPLLARVTGLESGEQVVELDSLTAVELRVQLLDALGVAPAALSLQRGLDVAGLVSLLVTELDKAPGSGPELVTHTFTAPDGPEVFGHLSLPEGPGPHPAAVVCTSGPGGALDTDGTPVRTAEHAPLRAAGCAVFTVDHRGAPGHGPEFAGLAELGAGDVDDVVAAAGYLAGLPEIDGDRIALVGTSRGAYTAALALTRAPGRWRRAALLMGLFDPAELRHRTPWTDTGRTPAEIAAFAGDRRRRPLDLAADVTTPVLLVHGEADERVPDAGSRAYATALGDRAELWLVPGMGHDNLHEGPEWREIWPGVAAFLSDG